MDLQNLKLSRLMILVENSNKQEVLEDIYFYCFSEYPLENLSIEDLQFNIAKYLIDADINAINKIYKHIYD
jgi:hypothetical protein